MLPVVTIVGRPNVGKSTLFNRLTKSKDALVVDLPGTTRDRKYGEGRVGPMPYLVVDTGGVGFEEDAIDFAMAKQSWEGIQQADVILFLVDGQTGSTESEVQLANKLRRLGKPILLVVNKTDGLDISITLADFFNFGFENPIPISAKTNRSIKQLAEKFCALLPAEETAEVVEITEVIEDEEEVAVKLEEEFTHGTEKLAAEEAAEEAGETEETKLNVNLPKNPRIRVAIVGRPNVGKSTLLNKVLGEERVIVFDAPGTTRDSIFVPFEYGDTKYTLIDTAGVRRRSRVKETVEKFSVIKALQAIEQSNVVVLMIDGQSGIADQDLTLASFVIEAGRGLVIAINKTDTLSKVERDKIHQELNYKFAFADFSEKFFISAKTGHRVKGLFHAILKAYNSATKKVGTPLLTKLLKKIVDKHLPPVTGGHRIKLRYAHIGGYNPPRIVIHGNQTEKLSGSYKRYLAKSFAKELDIVGTPVFLEFNTSSNPYQDK